MSKVSIIYHSYQGVSEKMAESLKEGVEEESGEASLVPAGEAGIEDLLKTDKFVLASGQPFGTLSGPVKSFLERLWLADEKEKLEEKQFTYLLNGNDLPEGPADRLEEIGDYFSWELAQPGIKAKSSEVDQALERFKELGKKLSD